MRPPSSISPSEPGRHASGPAHSRPTEQGFCAERWSRYLSDELERPVRVSFGRARRNVIVARTEGRHLTVRMNAFFGEAPEDVRRATASWLRSSKRRRAAYRRLDEWIAEAVKRDPGATRRRIRLRPKGRVHDLEELAAELVADELARGPEPLEQAPAVTWGRRGRARRALQLGSYDPEHDLIRMHPVLDQPAVPRFFVRYVLFHELLHAAIRVDPGPRGRNTHHGPRFRKREQAYAEYERALAWQETHLGALLRSARSGRDMSPRRIERSLRRLGQGWLFPC